MKPSKIGKSEASFRALAEPECCTREDREIAESAEKEAVAQLAIVRALAPLTGADRRRVLEAVMHLLEADRRVPGVIAQFLKAAGGLDNGRAAIPQPPLEKDEDAGVSQS